MKKLRLLMAFCALLIGWSNAMAQETPSNENAYYIYNADNDLFFTRGGAWGTQAYASPVGIPWRVEVDGSGNYTLKMYDIYTQNSDDHGMGFNGSYTDNGSPIALTPTGNASDGFTLGSGGNYVTCPATKGAVTMTSTASKWKFLTQAQYEAVLASRASTQEAAVAASKGIVIPGGNTLADVVSDVDAWTSTTTKDATPTKATWPISGNGDRKGAYNEGGYGVEMFQTNNASITRTITGLAEGIYKVAVRGMKRMGTNDGSVAMKAAGFYVSDAYMVANGNIIPVKSWAADNTANNVPDGPNAVVTIINDNNGYTTEGFVYVGDDGNLALTFSNESFWWGCWTVFNGVSYTFYNNEVSDEDATVILGQATALESEVMLASTKTALTGAKTTFDGARTIANYNALNTAIENANASIAAYAPLGTKLTEAASVKSSVSGNSPSYVTTFDTNIGAITSAYNAGNYAESAISTQVAAVETEIIALVKSQTVAGSDMTRIVPNAACTGAAGDDNWKIKNALASGEYFRLDTWAGTASGMSVPMIEYWITNGNTLSSNEMYQTITGLSNGVYRVTAETAVNNESKVAPNAGSALLFANDATTDITTGGTQTSFKGQTGTFTVEGVVSDGSLTLGLKAVSPNYNWIAFKNVHLYYMGAQATSDEKTALADAIAAAEGKTLGFEDGEYAPYNNVDALTKLAAAKAINPETASGEAVVAATTALTGATWTPNAGEVNAVYWADYTSGDIAGDGYIHPLGWTNTGYNTRIYSEAAGNKDTNTGISAVNNLAMMSKYNTTYGETAGYTMPLKANTIYKLTFKYCGWGNNPTTNIVLTDPESNTITLAPGFRPATSNGNTNAENWYSYTGYFVSTTAGNYVLAMNKVESGQQQIGIGDIELVSASELEFADGSAVPTYAPGTYPSVKITRTLTADRWATAVYPFAISNTDVDEIAVLARYNSEAEIIGFDNAASSTANVPFLMRSASNKSEITLSNVVVAAASATNAEAGDASLVGSYANNTAVTEDAGNYILSENTIYPVGENVKVNAYRAYINITGSTTARALRFVVGEITGVDNVEAATEATLKDGKYLENGKIVIVKNGQKFNANGQQVK